MNFSIKQTKTTILNALKKNKQIKKHLRGRLVCLYGFYAYKKHLSESCLFNVLCFLWLRNLFIKKKKTALVPSIMLLLPELKHEDVSYTGPAWNNNEAEIQYLFL